MIYHEEWLAISARIASLQGPAMLRAQHEISNTEDSFGVRATLGEECRAIIGDLEAFAECHKATLPESVRQALARSLRGRPIQGMKEAGPDIGRAMRAAVVAIPLIAAEVDHLLANRQERLRVRSAQAFEHLQRVLAVDSEVRLKWQNAFDEKGETSCEQLGAVHLLGHGIYAFKAHGSGARTDLVFNEPVDIDKAASSSEGLVLTEWKVAKRDQDVKKSFAEAHAQAESYASGLLSGLELTSYRYLVVVTKLQAPTAAIPAVQKIGGIMFQPINIAIEPRTPSAQSKKRSRPRGS